MRISNQAPEVCIVYVQCAVYMCERELREMVEEQRRGGGKSLTLLNAHLLFFNDLFFKLKTNMTILEPF